MTPLQHTSRTCRSSHTRAACSQWTRTRAMVGGQAGLCLAGVQAGQGKVEETRQRWARGQGGGTNSRDEGARMEPRRPAVVRKTQRHPFRPEILISNNPAFMDKAKETATATFLSKTSQICTSIHVDIRQKPLQCCKAIIRQLK